MHYSLTPDTNLSGLVICDLVICSKIQKSHSATSWTCRWLQILDNQVSGGPHTQNLLSSAGTAAPRNSSASGLPAMIQQPFSQHAQYFRTLMQDSHKYIQSISLTNGTMLKKVFGSQKTCFSVHLVLSTTPMLLLQVEQKMWSIYQKCAYLRHALKH